MRLDKCQSRGASIGERKAQQDLVRQVRKDIKASARPAQQLLIAKNRWVLIRHSLFYAISFIAFCEMYFHSHQWAKLFSDPKVMEKGMPLLMCLWAGLIVVIGTAYTVPTYLRYSHLIRFRKRGCPICGEKIDLVDFRHHLTTDHEMNEDSLNFFTHWVINRVPVENTSLSPIEQVADRWIRKRISRGFWPWKKPPLVVDARNLCTKQSSSESNAIEVDLNVIFSVWQEFRKQKHHVFWVFDANTRYLLSPEWKDFYLKVFRNHPQVIETYKGQRADEYVLIIAEACEGIVVSGDRFAPYHPFFDWLSTPKRFLRPSIRSGHQSLVLGASEIEVTNWTISQAEQFLNSSQ